MSRTPPDHGALRWRAPALVTALLAVAAATLTWRAGVFPDRDPIDLTRARGWVQAVAMSLLWLAAATSVIARTRADASLVRALRTAVKIHLALCLLAALALLRQGEFDAPGEVPDPAAGREVLGLQGMLDGLPTVDWLLPVIVAVLLVVLTTSALFLANALWANRDRFFRERGPLSKEARFGRGARVSAEAEVVQDVLLRARRALRTDDDARRAVIAAYAAMEDALVSRGVDRRPTETPTEVIVDALATGVLVSRDAATRLLDVFHTARFSSVPLGTGAVDDVDSALATLQQDLAARVDGR